MSGNRAEARGEQECLICFSVDEANELEIILSLSMALLMKAWLGPGDERTGLPIQDCAEV